MINRGCSIFAGPLMNKTCPLSVAGSSLSGGDIHPEEPGVS